MFCAERHKETFEVNKMDNTITFNDLIKKKYLEEMGGSLSINVGRIMLALLLALAIGFLIYTVSKKTFQGVVYSRSFNFSLILTSMVTAMIILPITSNLTLSLGMVGALSIVRFRAAIKEPLDIGYLFWSISVGITTGAGFYTLSIVGSLIIAAVIIAFSYIRGNNSAHYLLVLNYADKCNVEVDNVLEKLQVKKLKTKTATKDNVEVTYEVRVKEEDTTFVQELAEIDGVSNATLVSYNGEC